MPSKSAATIKITTDQTVASLITLNDRIITLLERQQQILDRQQSILDRVAAAAAPVDAAAASPSGLERALERHGQILQDMIDRGEQLQREARARADQRRAEVEGLRGELAGRSIR